VPPALRIDLGVSKGDGEILSTQSPPAPFVATVRKKTGERGGNQQRRPVGINATGSPFYSEGKGQLSRPFSESMVVYYPCRLEPGGGRSPPNINRKRGKRGTTGRECLYCIFFKEEDPLVDAKQKRKLQSPEKRRFCGGKEAVLSKKGVPANPPSQNKATCCTCGKRKKGGCYLLFRGDGFARPWEEGEFDMCPSGVLFKGGKGRWDSAERKKPSSVIVRGTSYSFGPPRGKDSRLELLNSLTRGSHQRIWFFAQIEKKGNRAS